MQESLPTYTPKLTPYDVSSDRGYSLDSIF